jgi:hypothetical protein
MTKTVSSVFGNVELDNYLEGEVIKCFLDGFKRKKPMKDCKCQNSSKEVLNNIISWMYVHDRTFDSAEE